MQIYIYIHTNILILRISMSVLAINWPWISLHVSAISQQSVNISPKPEPVQLTLFCQDAIGSSYGEVVHGAICQGVENVNLWPCHLGKRRSLKLIHEYNIPTKISLNSVIYIYYIHTMSINIIQFLFLTPFSAENKNLCKLNNHQSISVCSFESQQSETPTLHPFPLTPSKPWIR